MRLVWLVLLFPALVFAGEDCSMMNGTCRDVCAPDERAEKGAFLDCSDKQECCVKNEAGRSGDTPLPIEGKDRDQKSKAEN